MKKLKGILLSVVVATAAGAVILAISSLVVARVGELPRGPFLSVVATGIVCSAVFLGGLSASLLVGEKGALLGAACGLFFACCVAGVSLMLQGAFFTPAGAARLAAIFLGGCIGGILGVNRRKKVKF